MVTFFGVTMSIWGWSALLLGVIMVAVGRQMAAEDSDDVGLMSGVGESTIGSIGWGITLAGIAYVMWLSYAASDAVDALRWAWGPGRVWFGLGIVFYGGYIWTSVSGEVDSRSGMVDELRESVTGPILQIGGIISTILITAAVGVITLALVFGDILGFGFGLFADAPGFGAALFATLIGFVSTGGQVPLIDPFIPQSLRGLSPVWWLAIMLGVISVALGFASDNFEEGVS